MGSIWAMCGLYFAADSKDENAAFTNNTYEQFGEHRACSAEKRYRFR